MGREGVLVWKGTSTVGWGVEWNRKGEAVMVVGWEWGFGGMGRLAWIEGKGAVMGRERGCNGKGKGM